MTNLMDLDELVEFDGEETQEFKHMRIQQLVFGLHFQGSKCEDDTAQ